MSNFAIVFTTRTLLTFLLVAGSLFAGLTAYNSQRAHPRNGRYELQGEIVSIDKPHHEIEVKHGNIPGLMSAMTMAYEVRDEKALEKLLPGNQIRANVVVNGDTMTLENITVIKK
jgi:Cu/Ag efflux protein CusF